MQIKKGDNVIVITGKDQGKEGKVLRAVPAEDRVVVEGINLIKRRQRARKQGQKGQILEIPAALHVSNVLIKCSSCKKGVRVGAKLSGDKKERVCKSCGAAL